MPKTKNTTTKKPSTKTAESSLGAAGRRTASRSGSERAPVVVSMGCPSGVGPEVVLSAALSRSTPSALIVGDRGSLTAAAGALGLAPGRIGSVRDFDPNEGAFSGLRFQQVGEPLRAGDRRFGRPSAAGGRAQLEYIEVAYALAKKHGYALATAPVSKEAIARCGLSRARSFRGHTEWLEALDHAAHSVMCFSCDRLSTSLVTTHIPVSRVPRAISKELVARATLELVDLLLRDGKNRPTVAVASLNPHAGESKLLGGEELSAIAPGIERAKKVAGRRADIVGPIGAETAYRKGASGQFDGVVAMYHDQATIPMKLLDFGGSVNITQGLSIVRTSVDHGTAYDIAGQGIADARGMREAMIVAARLAAAPRKIKYGSW